MTEKKAIEILEKYSHTHQNWIDYLKKHPDFPIEYVGDIVHHERCMKDYESIISYLERL